jgi:hypothetical protein
MLAAPSRAWAALGDQICTGLGVPRQWDLVNTWAVCEAPILSLSSLDTNHPFLTPSNPPQNYKALFSRIAKWLRPGGLLFFHIFVHARGLPYHYEVSREPCAG